jgi:hypothetical protein
LSFDEVLAYFLQDLVAEPEKKVFPFSFLSNLTHQSMRNFAWIQNMSFFTPAYDCLKSYDVFKLVGFSMVMFE